MALKKPPTAPAPVAGIAVEMGGHEYVVPALTLYHVRQFGDRLKKLDLNAMVDPASMDLISEVAQAALKRNYPEITVDDVLQMLDVVNVSRVFEAFMGVSGFAPVREGDQPGESTGRS